MATVKRELQLLLIGVNIFLDGMPAVEPFTSRWNSNKSEPHCFADDDLKKVGPETGKAERKAAEEKQQENNQKKLQQAQSLFSCCSRKTLTPERVQEVRQAQSMLCFLSRGYFYSKSAPAFTHHMYTTCLSCAGGEMDRLLCGDQRIS